VSEPFSSSARVLIVDDEPQIRRTLELNLAARGFSVELAATGEMAIDMATRHHPDLVILDLGLPGVDGIEVVKSLRTWGRVPILILSARDSEAAKVAALDAGADDYVTKPFGINELLARIRAALRRAAVPEDEAVVVTEHFTVDLTAKRVTGATGEIRLTPTQWHLVEVLVRNQGRLVTQRQLLQQVWGPGYGDESHYLRVFMAQIRRKLEPDPSRPHYFVTEAGIGYRFEAGEK
jgi:two-component system KDP operon response regulator KdpE